MVGEARDGREAVRLASEFHPDMVLLDCGCRHAGPAGAARDHARRAAHPHAGLDAQIGDSEVIEALQLGARGVVLKHSPPDMVFKSIRRVPPGQYWVGRDRVAELIEKLRARRATSEVMQAGPVFGLTPRELEMVAAVVAGCSNSDIADKLAISSKTVKHHLTNIFDKLGLSNRLELALFAVQHRFEAGRFN